MWGHVNTEHTQYPKNMSIHKNHEDPNTPQTTKLPLSLLPLSISPFGNKAPKRKGDLVLSWRRRGLQAGSSGKLSGGVVGVVVRPVVVDRRGLLLNRSRRSSRSSWSSGSNRLGDDCGVRRRGRRDGSRVWLSGASSGRTKHLRL